MNRRLANCDRLVRVQRLHEHPPATRITHTAHRPQQPRTQGNLLALARAELSQQCGDDRSAERRVEHPALGQPTQRRHRFVCAQCLRLLQQTQQLARRRCRPDVPQPVDQRLADGVVSLGRQHLVEPFRVGRVAETRDGLDGGGPNHPLPVGQ